MINAKKALLLAVIGAMLFPVAASAREHMAHDVVKDARRNVVRNTFGNCVITKWLSSSNECGMLSLTREQRTVYFDFNKSTLNSKEKAKLDSLAKVVTASKQVDSVDIVGFADRIGNESYNKRLSMKRAETVKSYLGAKGLKTRNVRVEAMGESRPVTNCSDGMARKDLISCLAEDRRVEVMLNMR